MMKALWHDEDGMATVEYALLLMLVVIASLTTWSLMGTGVGRSVTASASALSISN
jgi:Flp pilus assembly pilin Flp